MLVFLGDTYLSHAPNMHTIRRPFKILHTCKSWDCSSILFCTIRTANCFRHMIHQNIDIFFDPLPTLVDTLNRRAAINQICDAVDNRGYITVLTILMMRDKAFVLEYWKTKNPLHNVFCLTFRCLFPQFFQGKTLFDLRLQTLMY